MLQPTKNSRISGALKGHDTKQGEKKKVAIVGAFKNGLNRKDEAVGDKTTMYHKILGCIIHRTKKDLSEQLW